MTITLEEARVLLRRAVDTQGRDFIYNAPGSEPFGCYYTPIVINGIAALADRTHNGAKRKTGCLIGVALSLSGEIRHLSATGSVSDLCRNFPGIMTFPAMEYFTVAQGYQDAGRSWGDAHDGAEDALRKGATTVTIDVDGANTSSSSSKETVVVAQIMLEPGGSS